jgi:hypothetical protein
MLSFTTDEGGQFGGTERTNLRRKVVMPICGSLNILIIKQYDEYGLTKKDPLVAMRGNGLKLPIMLRSVQSMLGIKGM